MSLDLVVRNGVIWSEAGWVEGDLLIQDGLIAGIEKPRNTTAKRVINAAGKHVLPGIFDAHIHLRDPGYRHKEDYATGTMAAAAGGVTTVLDQPNTDPVANTLELYKKHVENAEAKAYVDFNSIPSPSRPEHVGAMSDFGAAGFKIFQKKAAYPYDTEASIPESHRILEAFSAVAETGKPCAVHPHNNEIYQWLIDQAKKKGQLDARRFCEITANEYVYSSTVPQLLYLQEKTGVTYYGLHCHFPDYIEMIRRAKRRGANLLADCIYFKLVPPKMDEFDVLRNHLTVAVTEEQKQAIWRGLRDGTIDFIDTDHAPHTVEEIVIGREDPQKMALGLPGVEHFLSLLLTEVNRGVTTLHRLVQWISVNPAKSYHLYPRKGSLQIGTDADIVIVDLNKASTISAAHLYTKCQWTPYEGHEVKGIPTHTILRGKVICESGNVIGEKGYGRFVPVKGPVHGP
jgi:dihydroorotase (multifunctional complex type)